MQNSVEKQKRMVIKYAPATDYYQFDPIEKDT
jgi:hypothetical protein